MLYADDFKLFSVIRNHVDFKVLQRNLSALNELNRKNVYLYYFAAKMLIKVLLKSEIFRAHIDRILSRDNKLLDSTLALARYFSSSIVFVIFDNTYLR